MARLELRPFSEDFVEAAGELLAARFRPARGVRESFLRLYGHVG
jgi:hypothetical protein